MMSVYHVYRIQPQGAELHGIETETSNGNPAGGVHVFESIAELQACREWLEEARVELVTIACRESDLRANGDYEGVTLRRGRGEIVKRQRFASTREVAEWAAQNS